MSLRDNIYKAISEQAWIEVSELNDSLSLQEDLGLDSLDVAHIMSRVTDEYIDPEEWQHLQTVGDIVEAVCDIECGHAT